MNIPARRREKTYALYSLVRLLFDEAILAAIMLWLLPRFGIDIPLWLLISLMVGWGVYSCLISRLVAKVIGKTAAVGPEVLTGAKCLTITPLRPDGYVRVGNELWRAHSTGGDVGSSAEVVILGIKGLTLIVNQSMDKVQGIEDRQECV